MPFKRYVEIGRLALISFGPEYGQVVFVSDVVDENRVLVDCMEYKRRKMINLKRLELTDFTIEISRLFSKAKLKEALEKNDVLSKFKKSNWGKRLAKQEATVATTDFERYQAKMKRAATQRKIRALLEKQ